VGAAVQSRNAHDEPGTGTLAPGGGDQEEGAECPLFHPLPNPLLEGRGDNTENLKCFCMVFHFPLLHQIEMSAFTNLELSCTCKKIASEGASRYSGLLNLIQH